MYIKIANISNNVEYNRNLINIVRITICIVLITIQMVLSKFLRVKFYP